MTIPTGARMVTESLRIATERGLKLRCLPSCRGSQIEKRRITTAPGLHCAAAEPAQCNHSGQRSRRARELATVQHVAVFAGLLTTLWCGLFGAVSGHRLASPPNARNRWGRADKPFRHVQQSREARFDESRPDSQ